MLRTQRGRFSKRCVGVCTRSLAKYFSLILIPEPNLSSLVRMALFALPTLGHFRQLLPPGTELQLVRKAYKQGFTNDLLNLVVDLPSDLFYFTFLALSVFVCDSQFLLNYLPLGHNATKNP